MHIIIILDKVSFFFAYMALIKYRLMFKMARHRKYRLQMHTDSIKLAKAINKLI